MIISSALWHVAEFTVDSLSINVLTHTPTVHIVMSESSSKKLKLELSEAKISRLFDELFLNLRSSVVLKAQQQILDNNKGKFFSTTKESDYLKLDLAHVRQ
jgi:hypothetical protein